MCGSLNIVLRSIYCCLFFVVLMYNLITISYRKILLFRLKGLEQVTKATMLGHLLPVLLTSLMHPNLQTLSLADALMPQLVQLVLYTSQVGVCVCVCMCANLCFVVVNEHVLRSAVLNQWDTFFVLNCVLYLCLAFSVCSIRLHCFWRLSPQYLLKALHWDVAH